jgi:phosphoglycolate phosphatase-like HAD superfamily hydrolase
MLTATPALKTLGVPPGVPVVTRDQVEYAKNVPIDSSSVVGDSVWDLLAARRAHAESSASLEEQQRRATRYENNLLSL